MISVLTIAGSDSGGGAGIQADLKTFAAFGVHGVSAIAALTAQNTQGVSAVHVPPMSFLRAQIDVLFEDFRIDAVKLGMLANADVIHTVADALERHRARNIVLDPVMVASSGARLLDGDALDALRTRLIPMARLVTPNLHEAEWLLDRPIRDVAAMQSAGAALVRAGAQAVLMKGGHLTDREVTDLLIEPDRETRFVHPRLNVEGHGTGCTLSSAIAAGLATGCNLPVACKNAGNYVFGALDQAYRPGSGALQVLDHLWRRPPSPEHHG